MQQMEGYYLFYGRKWKFISCMVWKNIVFHFTEITIFRDWIDGIKQFVILKRIEDFAALR